MSSLGSFVWSIADQLRGVYKPHQYGNVILPMTILRRLDCILEPSRADVLAMAAKSPKLEMLAHQVRRKHGLNFFNLSPWTMQKLKADPDDLGANLIDYLNGFSATIECDPADGRLGVRRGRRRLRESGIVRTVYDPTAGTGGMLSVAEEHGVLRHHSCSWDLNPPVSRSDLRRLGRRAPTSPVYSPNPRPARSPSR